MEDNVVELGPHTRMTTEDILGLLNRERPEVIMVLYYYEDDNGNEAVGMRSTGMSRKDALWMLEDAKLNALGIIE